METPFATWLNTVFHGFDYGLLSTIHELAEGAAGFVLTPLLWFISFTGEVGALSLIVSLLLIFFKRTRKVGVCMLVAILIGALFTNVILKDLVARARPFDSLGQYHAWWQARESYSVSDLSFPSGHVTAATAAAVALIIASKKPAAWFALVYVVLMALSRMYFVVHYPSDVLGGLIVGALAAVLACWLVNALLRFAQKKRLKRITSFFGLESPQEKSQLPS